MCAALRDCRHLVQKKTPRIGPGLCRIPDTDFREQPPREVRGTGAEDGHEGALARRLSRCGKRHEEGTILASESPERLEELRASFLRALSELSGGPGEGNQAMISEVVTKAGLDPEGDPEDRALGERLAGELVATGRASSEAASPGFLAITPEGERAVGGAH